MLHGVRVNFALLESFLLELVNLPSRAFLPFSHLLQRLGHELVRFEDVAVLLGLLELVQRQGLARRYCRALRVLLAKLRLHLHRHGVSLGEQAGASNLGQLG